MSSKLIYFIADGFRSSARRWTKPRTCRVQPIGPEHGWMEPQSSTQIRYLISILVSESSFRFFRGPIQNEPPQQSATQAKEMNKLSGICLWWWCCSPNPGIICIHWIDFMCCAFWLNLLVFDTQKKNHANIKLRLHFTLCGCLCAVRAPVLWRGRSRTICVRVFHIVIAISIATAHTKFETKILPMWSSMFSSE